MQFVEFSNLMEASYKGNIGIMELIKFKQKANDKERREFDEHLRNNRHKEAWQTVQRVTGVKLHKSVHEEVKKDILPVAGAGQEGTPELVKNYKRMTPGQSFKDFWNK